MNPVLSGVFRSLYNSNRILCDCGKFERNVVAVWSLEEWPENKAKKGSESSRVVQRSPSTIVFLGSGHRQDGWMVGKIV